MQWLDELMVGAGREGRLHKAIENGINDLDTALKVLQMAGIMNSPDYWRNQAQNGGVEFLGQLIINIANRALDPMERIVWAEARGEDFTGQTLVANVVINRHRSSQFPNGFYNVIFAPNQFTPVRNGAYDRATPNRTQQDAVLMALTGNDESQGATFFHAISHLTPDSWHERATREGRLIHLLDHGNHRFYR